MIRSFSKISAETEPTRRPLQQFFIRHDTVLNERSVRRHYKTGIVKRKHLTMKTIQERLQHDTTTATDSALLLRSTFMSNSFCGSSTMSAFELARGYKPAFLSFGESIASLSSLKLTRIRRLPIPYKAYLKHVDHNYSRTKAYLSVHEYTITTKARNRMILQRGNKDQS